MVHILIVSVNILISLGHSVFASLSLSLLSLVLSLSLFPHVSLPLTMRPRYDSTSQSLLLHLLQLKNLNKSTVRDGHKV